MKRYSAFRKGQISLLLPVYIMAFMFIITSVYKLTSINIAKVKMYPYKEYNKKYFNYKDYAIINGFILKVDKNAVSNKEEIRKYLIANLVEMVDGENKVYFDSIEDKIVYIKKLETCKIKYKFEYDYTSGEIVLHRTSYYEGVI